MTRSYSSLLFWLGMVIVASLMLYHTSDRVNELGRQLRAINAQIDSEQQSLHVLKAEWVYLANPARVEAEVEGHLNLRPTDPKRVASLQSMSDLLPLQNGDTAIAKTQNTMPVQTAETAPAAHDVSDAPATQLPHTRRERIIAALNAGHINDHMLMQHKVENSGTVLASTDKIGALISSLGMSQ